jgi:hypothetical protein
VRQLAQLLVELDQAAGQVVEPAAGRLSVLVGDEGIDVVA